MIDWLIMKTGGCLLRLTRLTHEHTSYQPSTQISIAYSTQPKYRSVGLITDGHVYDEALRIPKAHVSHSYVFVFSFFSHSFLSILVVKNNNTTTTTSSPHHILSHSCRNVGEPIYCTQCLGLFENNFLFKTKVH